MTHERALEMRILFNYLFTLGTEQYYFVAIRKPLSDDPKTDWEVCLYGGTKHSSFLLELGTLATALDVIVPSFHTSMGVYDAGTTSTDERECIIIR